VVCHASKKRSKEKQLRAQCATVSRLRGVCAVVLFLQDTLLDLMSLLLVNPLVDWPSPSKMPCRVERLTLQPLVNSKPAGARAWSVCPRRYPVRRRSRSITANTRQVSHWQSIWPPPLQYPNARKIRSTPIYAPSPYSARVSHTLSVPLVHRVPGPLAAVLHVPDLRETGTRNAEELW
jgi:hypothetical protein